MNRNDFRQTAQTTRVGPTATEYPHRQPDVPPPRRALLEANNARSMTTRRGSVPAATRLDARIATPPPTALASESDTSKSEIVTTAAGCLAIVGEKRGWWMVTWVDVGEARRKISRSVLARTQQAQEILNRPPLFHTPTPSFPARAPGKVPALPSIDEEAAAADARIGPRDDHAVQVDVFSNVVLHIHSATKLMFAVERRCVCGGGCVGMTV